MVEDEMQIAHYNLENTLILNPVENIPNLLGGTSYRDFEGLYITDKNRTDEERFDAKILFAGRQSLIDEVLNVYEKWKIMLGAKNISFRLFSGLNAHMSLFFSVGNPGDTVLLLPEEGGGHYATPGILQRMDYEIEFLPIDKNNHCINMDAAIELASKSKARFLFIDRSEGLNYENFESLCSAFKGYAVFDASQYLTNILFGDFRSPFDMGFDMIVSTVHKNFPGPQQAFICSKEADDPYWERLYDFLKSSVSNIHAANILSTGTILDHPLLPQYSKEMLETAEALEQKLVQLGSPVVIRNESLPRTHHLWIRSESQKKAMSVYQTLENLGIMTNYRKLPYNLGYGLRLGTAAATLQGLSSDNAMYLAKIISLVIEGKPVNKRQTSRFIRQTKESSKYGYC